MYWPGRLLLPAQAHQQTARPGSGEAENGQDVQQLLHKPHGLSVEKPVDSFLDAGEGGDHENGGENAAHHRQALALAGHVVDLLQTEIRPGSAGPGGWAGGASPHRGLLLLAHIVGMAAALFPAQKFYHDHQDTDGRCEAHKDQDNGDEPIGTVTLGLFSVLCTRHEGPPKTDAGQSSSCPGECLT